MGVILSVVVATTLAGVVQNSKPSSATVVVVPSDFDSFMVQTGNIQITFSDGHSEVWTAEGNCTSPHVSSNGDVGWIRVDKSKIDLVAKNRQGDDKLIVQLPDGKRKEFVPNAAAPFIGNWSFADNDTAVAIQSSGYHGPRFYIKYDLSTGKVLGEIDRYVAYDELPSWARQISDQRAEK